jgi:hypothetical protein
MNLKFARINFRMGNNMLTYILSILGCLASIAIIIFVW